MNGFDFAKYGDRERIGFLHCHVSPLIHFLYSIQFSSHHELMYNFDLSFVNFANKEEEELKNVFVLINLVRPEADPFQNPHPRGGTMQPQTDTLTRLRSLAQLALPCVAGSPGSTIAGGDKSGHMQAGEQGRRSPRGIFDPKSG